jgi:catechol 2,3-dioxygenase-like lactoylglutathione lyase family enzyme
MIALADVAVAVTNAKESAEWWERIRGFAKYTVGGGGHAILVVPPGDRFVLHLCERFAPLEPGDSGIAFVTDETDPLIAQMTPDGVRSPQSLRSEEGGRMAKFSDPDGNVFWLLEVPTVMVRETLQMRARREPLECGPKRKARTDARREASS